MKELKYAIFIIGFWLGLFVLALSFNVMPALVKMAFSLMN